MASSVQAVRTSGSDLAQRPIRVSATTITTDGTNFSAIELRNTAPAALRSRATDLIATWCRPQSISDSPIVARVMANENWPKPSAPRRRPARTSTASRSTALPEDAAAKTKLRLRPEVGGWRIEVGGWRLGLGGWEFTTPPPAGRGARRSDRARRVRRISL